MRSELNFFPLCHPVPAVWDHTRTPCTVFQESVFVWKCKGKGNIAASHDAGLMGCTVIIFEFPVDFSWGTWDGGLVGFLWLHQRAKSEACNRQHSAPSLCTDNQKFPQLDTKSWAVGDAALSKWEKRTKVECLVSSYDAVGCPSKLKTSEGRSLGTFTKEISHGSERSRFAWKSGYPDWRHLIPGKADTTRNDENACPRYTWCNWVFLVK